jgi:hypothetical protein
MLSFRITFSSIYCPFLPFLERQGQWKNVNDFVFNMFDPQLPSMIANISLSTFFSTLIDLSRFWPNQIPCLQCRAATCNEQCVFQVDLEVVLSYIQPNNDSRQTLVKISHRFKVSRDCRYHQAYERWRRRAADMASRRMLRSLMRSIRESTSIVRLK